MKNKLMLTVGVLVAAALCVTTAAMPARADTPCGDYAVEYSYQPDSHDVTFTLPVPEIEGAQRTLILEVDGHSMVGTDDGGFGEFLAPFTAEDSDTVHHYYASSWARDAGLVVYACSQIGQFRVKF